MRPVTKLIIDQIIVPIGSTIGFGRGRTDDGTVAVVFAGDHRAMAALGDAIVESDEPIIVDVPEWAILNRQEL